MTRWAAIGVVAACTGAAWASFSFGAGALLAVVGVAGLGAAVRRGGPTVVLGVVVVACAVSGLLARSHDVIVLNAPVPAGRHTVSGHVILDAIEGRSGPVAVISPRSLDGVSWRGPALAVRGPVGDLAAGDLVEVTGVVRQGGFLLRGDPVAGSITVDRVDSIQPAGGVMGIANALRARVTATVAPERSSSAALVAGFLIGDTRAVDEADLDAMRRSGLSHYVAVSGSNVALFLGALWLVTVPLTSNPRRRALVGLAGLAVFVAATRAEPSVVRAATMAGLVLGGRAMSIPLDGWSALAVAVPALLLFDGGLAANVGFQLSVAATAGVMAGIRLFAGRTPRWAWSALGASIAAQAAVTPLLLLHFGSVPLASPFANVVTAPLVTASTSAGIGAVVTGLAPLAVFAERVAGAVITVAHLGADLPQLGVRGVAFLAVLVAMSKTRLRGAAAGLAAVLVSTAILPAPPPERPQLIALDVGQGDAIVVAGPDGAVVLVDTGPDPAVVRAALRRHRIDRIDLLILTHGDVDHVGGLIGVPRPRRMWIPMHPDAGLEQARSWAEAEGIPVTMVSRDDRLSVGVIDLAVLGPGRRYLADNDGSIVLMASIAGGASVLLPGDVETIAQRELPPVDPDVLIVPHHGAGTSDPAWLAGLSPAVAVISVGEGNPYGHPDPRVLEVLEATSGIVCRTDLGGDIVVDLVVPRRCRPGIP